MTLWAEVFLGVIALATLTMAAIQVGLIVYGWTVAKRVNRLFDQVEQQLQPLAENLSAIARDAARVSALATGQVERMDRLVTDAAARIEQTASTVQDAVLRPLREGASILNGIKAVIDALRDTAKRPGTSRGRSDEEDALFIG
ncbi:MAG TPA: hypothetical protein VJM31_02670 [Vicinamibacterales bacterium]|nr:hypothetical protein [Vicinamibacterales bacterium]